MTQGRSKSGFVSRPGAAEAWIAAPDAVGRREPPSPANCARLTIDVTPELRARIKVAAFRRGLTVATLIRDMLRDAFPDREDIPP